MAKVRRFLRKLALINRRSFGDHLDDCMDTPDQEKCLLTRLSRRRGSKEERT